MTDETREFLAKTMLFRHGAETVIWGIPLETIEVDDHEVDEYLADGWHAHPFGARDAQEAFEHEQSEAAAEEKRIKDEAEAADKKRRDEDAAAEAERVRLKGIADAAANADNELKEKLVAEAETLGVKIDKRWSTKNIQEAIDEAKKEK